jgi:hypothetical protein
MRSVRYRGEPAIPMSKSGKQGLSLTRTGLFVTGWLRATAFTLLA